MSESDIEVRLRASIGAFEWQFTVLVDEFEKLGAAISRKFDVGLRRALQGMTVLEQIEMFADRGQFKWHPAAIWRWFWFLAAKPEPWEKP